MIPLPGFIYFDKEFEFEDGEKGEKLFIVLVYSPRDRDTVLVARVTSKQKSTPTYGCHLDDRFNPVFFIPSTKSSFPIDTWIQFDYLVEYNYEFLNRMERKGELDISQTKSLLICASKSEMIPGWQKTVLEETANDLDG